MLWLLYCSLHYTVPFMTFTMYASVNSFKPSVVSSELSVTCVHVTVQCSM